MKKAIIFSCVIILLSGSSCSEDPVIDELDAIKSSKKKAMIEGSSDAILDGGRAGEINQSGRPDMD